MKKNDIQKQLDIFCDIISHILEVKSPHTYHHIQRVPIIAKMIAQAVNSEYKQKLLSPDEFYKINIAAKLHDCGKTTTADYLLEKSTKLGLKGMESRAILLNGTLQIHSDEETGTHIKLVIPVNV